MPGDEQLRVTIEGVQLPTAQVARSLVMHQGEQAMRKAMMTVERTWKERATRSRRTGTYLRSITHRVVLHGTHIEGVVGTNLRYAVYLEDGTGLYGPKNQWIVPKHARALRWPAGGSHGFSSTGKHTGYNSGGFTLAGRRRAGAAGANAQYAFAKRVRGIKPRKFAHDAALISKPHVQAIFFAAGRQAAHTLTGAHSA